MDEDGPKHGWLRRLRTMDKALFAEAEATAVGNKWAVAFNEGCQARLDGHPLYENPYGTSDNDIRAKWRYWREGWLHVDASWGKSVNGRWDYVRLKPCH